jgi:hypothetical protein
MPETLKWLVSVLSRFSRLIFSSRKKKLALIAQGIKDPDTWTNFWLEFRYAVRPLFFEAQQALNALRDQIERSSRNTARGYNRDGKTVTVDSTGVWPNDLSFTRRVTTTESHNYRAGVLYTIASDIMGLAATWGLDKPLESLYELVPFSFMLDWMFNIGDVIASWTYNPSLQVQASWLVEKHAFSAKVTYGNVVNLAGPPVFTNMLVSSTPASATASLLVERRLPSPTRAIMPSFKLKLNTAKIVDILAIARGLYHGLNR